MPKRNGIGCGIRWRKKLTQGADGGRVVSLEKKRRNERILKREKEQKTLKGRQKAAGWHLLATNRPTCQSKPGILSAAACLDKVSYRFFFTYGGNKMKPLLGNTNEVTMWGDYPGLSPNTKEAEKENPEDILIYNWAGEKKVTEILQKWGYEHGKPISETMLANQGRDIMDHVSLFYGLGLSVMIRGKRRTIFLDTSQGKFRQR